MHDKSGLADMAGGVGKAFSDVAAAGVNRLAGFPFGIEFAARVPPRQ